MRRLLFLTLLLAAGCVFGGQLPPIQTVFVIVLENSNWSLVKGNTNAPYINTVLLPLGSHCEQYYNPPGIHPSEPNYLWLEAGTNFGILDDNPPSLNSQSTTNHLVTLLNNAGISWKTYQESISGDVLPLTNGPSYDPRHNPFVFFDDVTGTNNSTNAYGLAHVRPYTELAGDLASNTVARYNFITPNLCDDGHDCALNVTDDWLSQQVSMIMGSSAYTNNGAIFITWDEGSAGSDGPIGMLVLSPLARGGGYYNSIYYNHGSTVRTMQEIFNVAPLLNGAANATDLSDLFGGKTQISVSAELNEAQIVSSGLVAGQSAILQSSTNLFDWTSISTNVSVSNSWVFSTPFLSNISQQFYRVNISNGTPGNP